ncbi:MAG TPA: hypothetical protein VNZ23_14320 [Xanthobacteraceae bacterium]|nr:hypothetical protein [Xanthobacteraceae bacterium]
MKLRRAQVLIALWIASARRGLPIRAMRKRETFLSCARAATIAAVAGAAVPASSGAAEAEAVSVTCTNPYSGATWRIAIDYDLKTVDANPASIDETQIWWRDGKDGWRYTLDRKSGALTVVLASATGGNFLFDQCRMP